MDRHNNEVQDTSLKQLWHHSLAFFVREFAILRVKFAMLGGESATRRYTPGIQPSSAEQVTLHGTDETRTAS